MEIISNVALISINETMLIQLISFLIFLYVFNRVMIRPLHGSVEERKSHMAQLSAETSGFKTQLDEISARIAAQEEAVLEEAYAQRHKIEDEGSQEADRILEQAWQDSRVQRRETEAAIKAAVESAREELARESERVAIGIMEKVLNRRLAS